VRRIYYVVIALAMLGLTMGSALAQEGDSRFPQPAFTSGYTLPETATPGPRAFQMEYLDVAVLAVALALASWLAIRGRSRRTIFLVTVFTVIYFGFYREGCVCAVGSLQNMTQAIMPLGAALPLVVAVFFLLPLAAALLFGRTFCSSVCPLGAIQDLVVMRPVSLPSSLAAGLSLAAPLYLSAVLLFAATGAGYMICRYDPFVGFFRLNGPAPMIFTGAAFLVAGMVVARPYCRFLCPYGVLLKWLSKLSKHHLTITPDICIQCRLCEDSCPFGAIREPSDIPDEETARQREKTRKRAFVLLPALALFGAVSGFFLFETVSGSHPTVELARELRLTGPVTTSGESLRLEAFRQSARTGEELFAAEKIVRGTFRTGTPLAGAFMGFMVGIQLLGFGATRRREGYEPDRGECLSCGRCIRTCPVEHVRVTGSETDFEAFLSHMRRRAWGGRATDLTADELKQLLTENRQSQDNGPENGPENGTKGSR
jgi:NosR/NirI family nitrous oxide reductase transcriptional regulator